MLFDVACWISFDKNLLYQFLNVIFGLGTDLISLLILLF